MLVFEHDSICKKTYHLTTESYQCMLVCEIHHQGSLTNLSLMLSYIRITYKLWCFFPLHFHHLAISGPQLVPKGGCGYDVRGSWIDFSSLWHHRPGQPSANTHLQRLCFLYEEILKSIEKRQKCNNGLCTRHSPLIETSEGINRESPGLGWPRGRLREPVLASSSLAQPHLLGFGPINMAARGPRLRLAPHTIPLAAESITT